MYLHIGGMDLAGKTTVVNRFIASTGQPWGIRKKFLYEDNHSKHAILLSKEDGAEVRGYIFLTALKEDIQRFKRPSYNTVQESCIILRSLAFYKVLGYKKLTKAFEELLPDHPKFDVSVILTADRQARLERAKARGIASFLSATDAFLLQDMDKLLEMEAEMVKTAKKWFGSIVIDTTDLDPSQVVTKMHGQIYE